MIPALAACLLLAGCATPRVQVQRVNVPLPVACAETVPERPHMPTESLGADATLDAFAAAAIAEIERREGYEVRLRAALDACTAPLPAAGMEAGG